MEASPPPHPTVAPAWPDAAPPPPAEWPLIGRDPLVRELADDLASGRRRSIALTGLGGIGKTRLAAEVAREVARALDGRVAWIALSGGRNGALAEEIASAVGIADLELDRAAEAIAEALDGPPTLLVLDAVEGVLHDLPLIDELLDRSDSVRVLVTSRISLARPSLEPIALGGLAVPAASVDAVAVAASPAVALLLDRARRAGADVSITERSAAPIGRLVRGLDGLPLAIEIAAPLLRVVPAYRLLERIGDHLDPLVATIGWSHDQLPREAQRLYRRLAVFGGAFSVADLRAFDERCVAHGLAPLSGDPTRELDRLVDAGLVRRRTTPPDRDVDLDRAYRLPSLVRDDAARRLAETGAETAAHWARAMCLLDVAEDAHAVLMERSRLGVLRDLDEIHDDLIAALEQARAAGRGSFMLRLAGALAEYWRSRGRLVEGRLWLEAALRAAPPDRSSERATALHGAGMLANWQSDFARSRAILEEALAIRLEIEEIGPAATTLNQLALIGLDLGELGRAEEQCRHGLALRRSLGDRAAIAASLNTLGGILQFGGRTDEAGAMFEESLAIRRGLDDAAGSSVSLGNLGLVARDRGDLEAAEAMFREAIETRERLGDRQRVAVVRHNLALVLFDRGDLPAARAELETALATARELGDRLETCNALSDLGFVEAAAGDLELAAAHQLEALSIAARIGAKGIVAQAIDGVAGLVAADDRPDEAATLWAAAERIRRDARFHLLLADRRRTDRDIAAARARADEDRWAVAWAAGEARTIDEAIAAAQAALGPAATTSRAGRQVAV